MAKPRFFSFAIKDGNPIRLATAIRDIVVALEPLTESECADILRVVAEMYAGAPPEQGPGVRR
jgi:hypothetical protein